MIYDQLVVLRVNGGFYGEVPASDLHELRADFNLKDDEWTIRCRDCKTPITEYHNGWRDQNNEPGCQGLEGDGTWRLHTPEDAALSWCQRALIIPNTAENSITARIDLPDAAFCLTIRREADGTLTLHLPHPDHASARKLVEQAPGVYEITD